ncbi:MAG: hypothetical protein WC907_04345 [Acholeplasmataceae bacterium]
MDRNLSQENFLHDVISLRQYRRYLSGDSTLSYVILDKLAKKLGFDAEYIIMELEIEKIKQSQNVYELYNAVVSKNFNLVKELLNNIDKDNLISENDILLYNHSINIFYFLKNRYSELETINKTKHLIGLDKLLAKKALSTSELVILTSLFQFDNYNEKHIIAEKLASYLDNNITIVSGHNIKVLALALHEIARYFSIALNYEKMYYYANEGIKYSIRIKSYYLLDSFYYFAGAASHELGEYERRDSLFTQCLGVSIMEDNNLKINRYHYLLKENFNIDSNELISNLHKQYN